MSFEIIKNFKRGIYVFDMNSVSNTEALYIIDLEFSWFLSITHCTQKGCFGQGKINTENQGKQNAEQNHSVLIIIKMLSSL